MTASRRRWSLSLYTFYVVVAIAAVWSGLVKLFAVFGNTTAAVGAASILVAATAIGMLACEWFLAVGDRVAEKFVSLIFPPKDSTPSKDEPHD
jgi:hypothetical protein